MDPVLYNKLNSIDTAIQTPKDILDLTFSLTPGLLSASETTTRMAYVEKFFTPAFVTTIAPNTPVMELVAQSDVAMAILVASNTYMTTLSNDTAACAALGKYAPAVKAITMSSVAFNIMKNKSAWYNAVNTNAYSMSNTTAPVYDIFADSAFLSYVQADTNGTFTFLKANCNAFTAHLTTILEMNSTNYTYMSSYLTPTNINIMGGFNNGTLTGKADLTAVMADTVTANLVMSNKYVAKALLFAKATSNIVLAAPYGVGRCIDKANELNNVTFQGYNTLANLFADANFRLATLINPRLSLALSKNYTILQTMLNTYPESTYNALYDCDVTILSTTQLEDDGNGLKILYGKNITINAPVTATLTATKALTILAEGNLTVSSTGSIDTRTKMYTITSLGSSSWVNRADLYKKSITIGGQSKLLVCPYNFTGSTLHKSLTVTNGAGSAGGAGGANTASIVGGVGGVGTSASVFSGGAGGGGGGGAGMANTSVAIGGAGGTLGVSGAATTYLASGAGGGGGGGFGANGGNADGAGTGGIGNGILSSSYAGGNGGIYGGTYNGSNGDGGGGGTQLGGGGGGGTGASSLIFLNANIITISPSGYIKCNGNSGGGGGNSGWNGYGGGAGGGGGGAGGSTVYITYKSTYTNNGTIDVSGGTGGPAGIAGGSPTGSNGSTGGTGSVGSIISELIA